MIIMRGIYTVLYSRAAKTESTLQRLKGIFFMKIKLLQFLFENNIRFNKCPQYRKISRP